MTRDAIEKKINDFLHDEFEIDEQMLLPDAQLKDDLEIESLDFVDIVVIIEDEFGFKVKNEDIIHLRTLSDLYEYIENQVQM